MWRGRLATRLGPWGRSSNPIIPTIFIIIILIIVNYVKFIFSHLRYENNYQKRNYLGVISGGLCILHCITTPLLLFLPELAGHGTPIEWQLLIFLLHFPFWRLVILPKLEQFKS